MKSASFIFEQAMNACHHVKRHAGGIVGDISVQPGYRTGFNFSHPGDWHARWSPDVMREIITSGATERLALPGLTLPELNEVMRARDDLDASRKVRAIVDKHGGSFRYRDLTDEEKNQVTAPRYGVGDIVVVLSPWWRRGAERARCKVREASGFNYRGEGYSLEVVDELIPGAHGRSVKEMDIEGFSQNQNLPTMNTN